jgi:hypothetical protein
MRLLSRSSSLSATPAADATSPVRVNLPSLANLPKRVEKPQVPYMPKSMKRATQPVAPDRAIDPNGSNRPTALATGIRFLRKSRGSAMRRLLTGVFAASFLLGMMTGCATTGTSGGSCGTGGCSTCSTGTCGTGACGSGGCSTCGGGAPHLNFLCHTTGVCDCDHDEDPCAHRAPWASVRPVNYPMFAKTTVPAATPIPTVEDQPIGAAPVVPQALPTSNSRR